MRIRIRDLFDPGNGIRDEKIRIRDKYIFVRCLHWAWVPPQQTNAASRNLTIRYRYLVSEHPELNFLTWNFLSKGFTLPAGPWTGSRSLESIFDRKKSSIFLKKRIYLSQKYSICNNNVTVTTYRSKFLAADFSVMITTEMYRLRPFFVTSSGWLMPCWLSLELE